MRIYKHGAEKWLAEAMQVCRGNSFLSGNSPLFFFLHGRVPPAFLSLQPRPHDSDDSDGEFQQDAADEEARNISECALQCYSLYEPGEKVLTGPGMQARAPRRYLGVTRPSLLYLWMRLGVHPHV